MKIQILMVSLLLSAGASAMPMLTFDGPNVVTGATGFVGSDGMNYSMTFQDGTCIDLYSGCDSNADFNIGGTTQAALTELFFNEFIGPPASLDSLDSNPAYAVGCEVSAICLTWAPLASLSLLGSAGVVVGLNSNIDARDSFAETTVSRFFETHAWAEYNWSVWTKDPATVPEPGSLALLALGLAGLGLSRKGKTA